MTPEERIDANLDAILRSAGSALKYYTMAKNLEQMRESMRKVMSESYIAGVHAQQEVMEVKSMNEKTKAALLFYLKKASMLHVEILAGNTKEAMSIMQELSLDGGRIASDALNSEHGK